MLCARMSVCARARGFCADADTRAGAHMCVCAGASTCMCVTVCLCVCVRACVRACVCVWASMRVRFSGRSRVHAGVRAGVYISKLCRPLTCRHANYQSKNCFNHNNLRRQNG